MAESTAGFNPLRLIKEAKILLEAVKNNKCTITVVKIPDGSAPEEYRRSWVGLKLSAVEIAKAVSQVDPLRKGKSVGTRPGFMVQRAEGIMALKEAEQDTSAQWYEQNWPKIQPFIFGVDEVVSEKVDKKIK